MKRSLVCLVVIILFASSGSVIVTSSFFPNRVEGNVTIPTEFPEFEREMERSDWDKALDIHFTENLGQLEDPTVKFFCQGGGIWFTDDGVYFDIREEVQDEKRVPFAEDPLCISNGEEVVRTVRRGVILKQEFLKTNTVTPQGASVVEHYSNFFLGNDGKRWRSHVPNFEEVWYRNIYDDIDLRYHWSPDGLKYYLILHPQADPYDIRFTYPGADRILAEDGKNLLIRTPMGDLEDGGLFIYQEGEDGLLEIAGSFIELEGNVFGFEITDPYDPQKDLIIDPLLVTSTYLGGTLDDLAQAIAVNTSGEIFLTGYTSSSDFPTSVGAYQTSYGGNNDIFISKFSSDMTSLIFSSYLGGSSDERGSSVQVDQSGNFFVTGYTMSPDFPTTPGAYDTTYAGDKDVIVSKLNTTGTGLLYSTYIGGSGNDAASGLALGATDMVFVAGNAGDGFPTTAFAYDTTNNGGRDCFALGLDISSSSLEYSTFMGGFADNEGFLDIEIGSQGNIHLVGNTESSDFPISSNTYDSTYGGGSDAIVVVLDPTLSTLFYSTFIGDSGLEMCNAMSLDSQGYVVLVGHTTSTAFPTTPGAFDTTYNNGQDAFVVRINTGMTGSGALMDSTFIGGSGGDHGMDITVDVYDNVFITGFTMSSSFPITDDAYDTTGDGWDGYLTQFSKDCSSVLHSTFIGGSQEDRCYGMTMDQTRDLWVCGETLSTNFPTVTGSYDEAYNGGGDVFALKYRIPQVSISNISILRDYQPNSTLYTRLCEYTFEVEVVDTLSIAHVDWVDMVIDPEGANIKYRWDRASDGFAELSDPNDHADIEYSSDSGTDMLNTWTLDYDITLNWNYPHEDLNGISVCVRTMDSTHWRNESSMFTVENDLEFMGDLKVASTLSPDLQSGDWVKDSETLTWSGLTVVYEGTTNEFPPDSQFDVTISDDDDGTWSDTDSSGHSISIVTHADTVWDGSDNHTISITGVPPYCVRSNITFELKVDDSNVTFHNPTPSVDDWQRESYLDCGITITDEHVSLVDGPSVAYRTSMDNGSVWTPWGEIGETGFESPMTLSFKKQFLDGDDNLIQWRALDAVGNGLTYSDTYRLLVDTKEIEFNVPLPGDIEYVKSLEMVCSVNISDVTSGVDMATMEYSILKESLDDWSPWRSSDILRGGKNVTATANVKFDEGRFNFIRWRGYDIAGNGPTESDEFQVKCDVTDVTFKEPKPPSGAWYQDSQLSCGITCEDTDGSGVNGSSLCFRTSFDMGMTWSPWSDVIPSPDAEIIVPLVDVSFPDGDGNLIQWRAQDMARNGPVESEVHGIMVDTEGVGFSSHSPEDVRISPSENVVVNVTLFDQLSGVNASTIEYSTSTNGGTSWSPWKGVGENENDKWINVTISIPFPGGSGNRVKWRASDVAGNGPIESIPFVINVSVDIFAIGLEPVQDVSISSGSATFVGIRITNLGSVQDRFFIHLNGSIPGSEMVLNVTSVVDLGPSISLNVGIWISISNMTQAGDHPITITVTSLGSSEKGETISENQTFMVHVIASEDEDDDGGGKGVSTAWYAAIAILIILVLLIISLVSIKRRRNASLVQQPMAQPPSQPEQEGAQMPAFQTQATLSDPQSVARFSDLGDAPLPFDGAAPQLTIGTPPSVEQEGWDPYLEQEEGDQYTEQGEWDQDGGLEEGDQYAELEEGDQYAEMGELDQDGGLEEGDQYLEGDTTQDSTPFQDGIEEESDDLFEGFDK